MGFNITFSGLEKSKILAFKGQGLSGLTLIKNYLKI